MSNGNGPKIDRQREHQANERTFLAWLRTSIALIGFGFAIARFGLFLRQLQVSLTPEEPYYSTSHHQFTSENLGVTLVIFGVLTLLLATWRYNQVFQQIERGDYRPSRFLVWVMSAFVMIMGVLSIPFILWRPQDPRSPSSPPNQRFP